MIVVTMVRIRPYKFVLLSTKGDFPSWERIIRISGIPKTINKENNKAVFMVIELIGSSEEAKANVNWSKLLGSSATKINLEKVPFKNFSFDHSGRNFLYRFKWSTLLSELTGVLRKTKVLSMQDQSFDNNG